MKYIVLSIKDIKNLLTAAKNVTHNCPVNRECGDIACVVVGLEESSCDENQINLESLRAAGDQENVYRPYMFDGALLKYRKI